MSEQGDYATYRVLVFGRDGTEILLTRSHAGVQFPKVRIPQWERVAEKVTSAVKRAWGQVVVCLFELDSWAGTGTSRYVAARHWRSCATSFAHLQWISAGELSENSFSDPDDYRALRESLAKCRASSLGTQEGPFVRVNWFEELCGWVSQAIAAKGLRLTGDFRQLNASPTFSLIRFETNGPAVWFKAVGKPKEREFSITPVLSQALPRHVPQLLASNTHWNGWLTSEFSGIELAETQEIEKWRLAAEALGTLQIESLGKVTQFRAAGAHELSPAKLSRMVDPFLEIIDELMAKQPKVPPPVLTRKELASLGRHISDALSLIERLSIPDALGHLDPNPGNIVIAPKRCVFLDWAEAYIGHPFYTFEYLLEHFRRTFGDEEKLKRELIKSYVAQWQGAAFPSAIDEALAVTPLLAVFAYAAGSGLAWDSESLQQPSSAGYLRSLARRMNREATQMVERRPQC